jgi:GT2 family glycosyltransferase
MEGTINSLKSNQTSHALDLIAIVNGLHGNDTAAAWIKKNFNQVEDNDVNILARAWNKGIRLAFERGADYCLVINLDLLFHPKFLDNLIAFAQSHPEAIAWSGMLGTEKDVLQAVPVGTEVFPVVSFCAFLIDRRLLEAVGPFDEQFSPAYFEDSDMVYRIKLRGLKLLTTASALFHHFESVTLQSAIFKTEFQYVKTFSDSVKINEARFVRKWGGVPGSEQYQVPYDGKPA